jgi:hypothetical protein
VHVYLINNLVIFCGLASYDSSLDFDKLPLDNEKTELNDLSLGERERVYQKHFQE